MRYDKSLDLVQCTCVNPSRPLSLSPVMGSTAVARHRSCSMQCDGVVSKVRLHAIIF